MAWVLKMDDATIESGLVHDFDASLSGIGQELGAGAYSMRLEQHANRSAASQESLSRGRCIYDGGLVCWLAVFIALFMLRTSGFLAVCVYRFKKCIM